MRLEDLEYLLSEVVTMAQAASRLASEGELTMPYVVALRGVQAQLDVVLELANRQMALMEGKAA